MLMGPLLLQNPGKKTKPGEHREILKRRLDLWKSGKFNELLAEGNTIQSRLGKGAASNSTNQQRTFARRLMFQGKVGAALRVLSTTPSKPLAQISKHVLLTEPTAKTRTLRHRHKHTNIRSWPSSAPS